MPPSCKVKREFAQQGHFFLFTENAAPHGDPKRQIL
jgi:hypothetical protein